MPSMHFEVNVGDRHTSTGRLLFGLLLLVLGVLWTLDNLDFIESESVTRWWPALLLLFGACRLIGLGCRRRPVSGAIWSFIGAWLLLRTFHLVSTDLFDFWPVALILLGSALVYRAWQGRPFAGVETEGTPLLHASAVIGAVERKVIAERFRGGEVNAIMGGAEIDLRGAKLADNHAVIDVFALWGGIDLIVPQEWRVITEVTPIMGGFEDATAMSNDPGAPTLVLRGLVIMGGVEIKNSADADRAEARRHRHERRMDFRTGSEQEERRPRDPEARG